ncbi:hypothetical protein EDB83DRAFT_243164 [Lactarius deliciosus]|nr:hypothetical protein EDB83DRAFT_243164 [Lactarius deliciosus]
MMVYSPVTGSRPRPRTFPGQGSPWRLHMKAELCAAWQALPRKPGFTLEVAHGRSKQPNEPELLTVAQLSSIIQAFGCLVTGRSVDNTLHWEDRSDDLLSWVDGILRANVSQANPARNRTSGVRILQRILQGTLTPCPRKMCMHTLEGKVSPEIRKL